MYFYLWHQSKGGIWKWVNSLLQNGLFKNIPVSKIALNPLPETESSERIWMSIALLEDTTGVKMSSQSEELQNLNNLSSFTLFPS